MKRIAVFCGSSEGNDPLIWNQCENLANLMCEQGIGLVYGAAKIGLMGRMAEVMLRNDLEVIGVIPKFLMSKEIVNENIDELIITDNMHDRKVIMYERSDGFVILPGGFGTMDEFFEITTWGQLGLHQKPIGILNSSGFYTPLIEQMNNMTSRGFLKEVNRDAILIDDNPLKLLDKMKDFTPQPVPKWLKKEGI